MITKPDALLMIPHLQVQNVNAISSPLTWGFPAPSAFTGFVHALHHRIAAQLANELDMELNVTLDGIGIVCHRFQPQVTRPSGKRTYVFSLTRNPIDKDGTTAAIVEEGRAHMEVSLLIGASGDALHELGENELANRVLTLAASLRLAGGSVWPSPSERHQPEQINWPGNAEAAHAASRRYRRRLLPGFALVNRDDLLKQHQAQLQQYQPDASALDALLDLSRINVEPIVPETTDDNGTEKKIEWAIRPRSGWLVPIPVGYGAISALYPPGEVKNARDKTVPFRFVESLYGLGQWLSPHRIDDLSQLLWYHHAEPEAGLYRCVNGYSDLATAI